MHPAIPAQLMVTLEREGSLLDAEAGGAGDCAKLIACVPKNNDPTRSPTANDPNAKVVLDIMSPLDALLKIALPEIVGFGKGSAKIIPLSDSAEDSTSFRAFTLGYSVD